MILWFLDNIETKISRWKKYQNIPFPIFIRKFIRKDEKIKKKHRN